MSLWKRLRLWLTKSCDHDWDETILDESQYVGIRKCKKCKETEECR